MTEQARLDHVVINAGFEMDQAEGLFADFGFTVTPRGYHTLGSINHLMIFGTDYLELIGLPKGTENPRPDIANAPYGINGLVFKTANVDTTHAHLESLGMAGDPPKAFSRPVQLPEGDFDASFRTVHVRPDVFPGGRVYFCEHQTPELVWRQDWQSHANGAKSMPEFIVASNDWQAEAAKFAKLLQADAATDGDGLSVAISGARLTVLSPEAYALRYGDLASPMNGRGSIFGAVVFKTGDLDDIRQIASKAGSAVSVIDEASRVVLREPTFGSVLEFIA